MTTVAELMALSRPGVGGQSALKFTIPQFDRPADAPELARAHLMDGNFYSLHDEWYYYRLLNGSRSPATTPCPSASQQFVDDRRDLPLGASACRPATLPLDLTYIGERLYAAEFYDLASHGDPRRSASARSCGFPTPLPASRPLADRARVLRRGHS